MLKLQAKKRTQTGKGSNHRLRAQGEIPGILYGKGITPIPVSIYEKHLQEILSLLPREKSLFLLQIQSNGAVEEYPVVIREIQRHYLDWTFLHLDFYRVDPDERIELEIPVLPEGNWEDAAGRGVRFTRYQIKVKGKASLLPGSIHIPVDNLQEGQKVYVKDLSFPEGVEPVISPEELVLLKA